LVALNFYILVMQPKQNSYS